MDNPNTVLLETMAQILILYGTTEGQTRRIATVIGQAVRAAGHEADLLSVTSLDGAPVTDDADGVIVGASVHGGQHQTSVVEFVTAHREVLADRPSAFFSVSLAVLDDGDPDVATGYVSAFLEETDWSPDVVATFAGALRYTKYGFLKRFIMKQISRRTGRPTDTSRDFEFTDWEEVDAFVDAFLQCVDASGRALSPSTQSPTSP